MPSDNLEKYIKEKLAAVQHTPPPGSNWEPEAAWLKLQQPPVPTRRKKTKWFSYAAAVLVLVLSAGIIRQFVVSKQPNTEIVVEVVATTPTKEAVTSTGIAATKTKQPVEQPTENITTEAQPDALQLKLALGKKIPRSVKSPALPVTSPIVEQPIIIPDAPPTEAKPDAKATPEAVTLAETPAQPLKITIVLGKTSTAKMLNQTATNLPAKRRKTRLHLNVPNSENLDNNHLALTDSSYQPLKLQARIDL